MKLTKLLIGSTLAIPTVTIPLTTLSSCGSVWGYQTPYMIGSIDENKGPYNIFVDQTDLLDADMKPIFGNTYLQSSYAVDVANSTNYAYATPMKFVDGSTETKDDFDWEEGNSGWYTSSDAVFVKSVTHNYKEGEESKTQTATNARNATLSTNTDFVAVIGSTINSYISLALQYQATQLNANDPTEKDLKIAWGLNGKDHHFDLDHGTIGDKDDEENRKFYEEEFAFSNLVGTRKVNALLRTSSVDFNFGRFPIPSYSGENKESRQINEEFIHLLEGTDATSLDDAKYYSSKNTEVQKDDEGDEYYDLTYTSVPVVINVNGIEQTYLNPTIKDKSFLVNDYYSSNDEIVKSVGNSWKKNFPKFTGVDEANAVPTYKTFHLKTTNDTYAISVNSQDTRINLQGQNFVALVDYAVRDYTTKNSKDVATLIKLNNVFPSLFLDILGNDAYKPVRDDADAPKIIDTDKINTVASTFTQLLKRESKEGQKAKASDLKPESQHLLAFLGYMFGVDGEGIPTYEFLVGDKM